MVTGVGATMPTGGVTVGATPPAPHVPQEAGQPPAQTNTANNPATPTTTTTRRSGENRRVSIIFGQMCSQKIFIQSKFDSRVFDRITDLRTKSPSEHLLSIYFNCRFEYFFFMRTLQRSIDYSAPKMSCLMFYFFF